jgi:hypothetical protein
MKKLFVLTLAALLMGAFTLPAMAVDYEFGGMWNTRAFMAKDFSGNDDESQDGRIVDTRTRIKFNAIFSDELKLVNQFEMDADYGDQERGDIGSDGQNFEVKHSYADITVGEWNAKLGTQGKTFARGFMFDDDFTGAIVRYVNDDMIIPFVWIKAFEGEYGKDSNDLDFDYYAVDPVFMMDDLTLNPFFMYMYSGGGGEVDANNEWTGWDDVTGLDKASVYYVGLNVDYSADMFSAWFTGIYSGGEIDIADDFQGLAGTDNFDVEAYLVAAGGTVNFESVSVHGQAFYATGDDDGLDDDETNTFFVPAGQSYYWSEIMGLGTFDDQASAGSPGGAISNIMAFNVGVAIPFDKLTLTVDLWNATLAEDNANGDDDLGTEIDVAADYELLEDLSLRVVAAYLAADDATGGGDEDPIEVGARLSLKF